MLDITEEMYEKQLLDDFYRLRKMLVNETNHNNVIKIIDDIRFIGEILSDVLLIDFEEYNDLEVYYDDLFKEAEAINGVECYKCINRLREDYTIHKNIFYSSKKNYKTIKI